MPDDETVELITRLSRHIAKEIRKRVGYWVPVDDLVQAGVIEGFRAWNNYDPSKGASFVTYAFKCISGVQKRELARIHRNTPGKPFMKSIDRDFPADPDHEADHPWGTLQVTVEDPKFDEFERQDEVAHAMKVLDEIERFVIKSIFFDSMTLVEVGRILGKSKSTISRIKHEALEKMKRQLGGNDVTPDDTTR